MLGNGHLKSWRSDCFHWLLGFYVHLACVMLNHNHLQFTSIHCHSPFEIFFNQLNGYNFAHFMYVFLPSMFILFSGRFGAQPTFMMFIGNPRRNLLRRIVTASPLATMWMWCKHFQRIISTWRMMIMSLIVPIHIWHILKVSWILKSLRKFKTYCNNV